MKKSYILIILLSVLIIAILIYAGIKFKTKNETDKNNSNIDIYEQENSNNTNTDENIPPSENKVDEVVEEIKPKEVSATVPIFMYHFVTDEKVKATDIENYLTAKKLEEQFKYIVENSYETIYVSELENVYKYEKPVAITIDDGFLFYDTTFQLLKKYKLKATLNVIVNYINGPEFLTLEQLQEIKESGLVEIQSHTLSHRKLASLKVNEINVELEDSKKYLKEKLDIDSTVLCYPIGSYNQNVIKKAKELYKYALKMDGGLYNSEKNNNYEIPRIYVNRSMSMTAFASYLKRAKVDVVW